jgi:hypothetical protein
LRVPASLKVANSVGILSNNGGSLIGDRGGSIVSDRGSDLTGQARARRVLVAEVAPAELVLVRGARVYLADASGARIPTIPAVETDARGAYRFPSVPSGFTFVVAAEVPTADDRVASFRSLVEVVATGASTDVDPASTIVTAGVVSGLAKQQLGALDAIRFQQARDALARRLTFEALPDFTDGAAVKASFEAKAAEVAELREAVTRLQAEMTRGGQALDEPQDPAFTQSDASPDIQPVASPSPSEAVVASPTPSPEPFLTAAPLPTRAPSPTNAPIASPSPARGGTILVSTVAGSTVGSADGSGAAAQFNGPVGIAVDAAGNLFVADYNNHRIRQVARSGAVTTLAGSASGYTDGTGAAAQFSWPWGIALDARGNLLVGDKGNYRLRKVTPTGSVTTVAGSTRGNVDGTGTAAKFDFPRGLALDAGGNVFVADASNHRIRKVTPAGEVTTVAGSAQGYMDGAGSVAQFNNPAAIALRGDGNLLVADTFNHRIRKVTPTGEVTTLAGSTRGYADGTGAAAQFNLPYSIALDAAGNLFVADASNHRIRKVTPTGEVTTVAGSTQGYADGAGAVAQFNSPAAIALDGDGNLFVSDTENQRIRKITLQ